MRLYIVGVAIESQDRFVDVTFTLEFESDAEQTKSILKHALINQPPFHGVVEVGNSVQCTVTCATVAKLRECVEALADVEREVVSKLNEIERVERIAKACAGYYVKQVLDSRMWNEDTENEDTENE